MAAEDPVLGPPEHGEPPRPAVLQQRENRKTRKRDRPQWRGGSRRQAVYFIVLAMLGVGLLLVLVDQWRRGLVVMGASILLGGIARSVLPTRLVGWLAVRHRPSDLVFCLTFGVLLIVTAVVARGEI